MHGENANNLSSRCWIHARNVADGLLFLFQKAEPAEFYHIVGEEKSVLEMAEIIMQEMKLRTKINYVNYHLVRPGHDKRYALSGEKLKQMGWAPPVDLESSLRKTVRWSLANPQWL